MRRGLMSRMGQNNLQVALFSDRVSNTALVGTGEVSSSGGFLLPDIYSGTFTYGGNDLDTRGLRVVLLAEIGWWMKRPRRSSDKSLTRR